MSNIAKDTLAESEHQGQGLISRMRNERSKWKFVKMNFNKIRKFTLTPTLYDKVGRLVFERYIKEYGNFSEVQDYWNGFVLCKKLQYRTSLVKNPGILCQTMLLSRCYRLKKVVSDIIVNYEKNRDIEGFIDFLIGWEKAIIFSLALSQTYLQYLEDLKSKNSVIKTILYNICHEEVEIDNKKEKKTVRFEID